MIRHRKNAGKGYGMMFHGAFSTKADAKRKEHRTKGAFIRSAKMGGETRYMVLSPRKNPRRRHRHNPADNIWMEARRQLKNGRWKRTLREFKTSRGADGWAAKKRALGYDVVRANPIAANPAPELMVMAANPKPIEESINDKIGYPKQASNPGAAELYKDFQGKEPEWVTNGDEPHMPAGDYAKLGDLVGLTVKPANGGQVRAIQWFSGWYDVENYSDRLLPLIAAPMVVADHRGRQIYFFGGSQEIASSHFPEARPLADGKLELGEARVIRYRTKKSMDDFELLDYVHRFGEESGVQPTVIYDSRNKRLLLEGGNYRVEAPGIID